MFKFISILILLMFGCLKSNNSILPKDNAEYKAKGNIKSLDGIAQVFVIRTSAGLDSFQWNDSTYFINNTGRMFVKDIKENDSSSVYYKMNNKIKIATRVSINVCDTVLNGNMKRYDDTLYHD